MFQIYWVKNTDVSLNFLPPTQNLIKSYNFFNKVKCVWWLGSWIIFEWSFYNFILEGCLRRLFLWQDGSEIFLLSQQLFCWLDRKAQTSFWRYKGFLHFKISTAKTLNYFYRFLFWLIYYFFILIKAEIRFSNWILILVWF